MIDIPETHWRTFSMTMAHSGRKLSDISTDWAELALARDGSLEQAIEARRRLFEVYGISIYKYLKKSLSDPDEANELYQEFSLRFARGDFRLADPARGRFRDYLKRALANLIADHYRRRESNKLVPLQGDGPAVEVEIDSEIDREFTSACRDNLVASAMSQLADIKSREGRPLHTVLRLHLERPGTSSRERAEILSLMLGVRVTNHWFDKSLHLARVRFAELLLDGVVASLKDPTPDEVEEELIDLGLFPMCRVALQRWRGSRRSR
jgi:DNA-directed RNA polymerase specialized sigma24 family protein